MRSPGLHAVLVLIPWLLVAAPGLAQHQAPEVEAPSLVWPERCLAGSWGQSSMLEWRVQLGVFEDAERARAFAADLRARGVPVESFIAIWLARDDREPIVVVSQPFATRAAAVRARERYGPHAQGAFARRYRTWR